jgi:hypothetical protein
MALPPVAVVAPTPAATPVSPTRPSFAALLESRTPFPAPTPAAAATPHPALSALAGVERAQARLDAVLAAARAGRTFTAAELIGLQAEAYRCAQTVDLASKLVEQGAQSVKQALNTQL